MEFIVQNNTGENISIVMRELRYHFYSENKPGSELSFIRYLGQSAYPRFHIYLREDKKINEVFFNIHLDQKRPVYSGAPAHSAEYNGEVLEKEVERIREFFKEKNDE